MTDYVNSKEVSNDIVRVSELGDQLKNLYFNYETADKKVIAKLENDFAEKKMDIADWLKKPTNYDLFKSSPDAKQALFFKQVQEGFYNHEIGLNQELKDKIYRDFLEKFNLTPPEELMTAQEKRNFQMLQKAANGEQSDYKNTLIEEGKFLFNVYSRTRCFEGNWDYVKKNLPGHDILDGDTLRILRTVKDNPHFLADNPNHFLKNQGQYKGKAPELKDVFEAVHASALGSRDGKEKIKAYEKIFNAFAEKKPEAEAILSSRQKAFPNNDMGLGLDKPKPF